MKKIQVCFILALFVGCAVCDNSICNERDDGRYPHETNCTKFVICSNGLRSDLDCPSNLHFSDIQKKCDFPEFAGCASATTNAPSTTGSPTTKGPPITFGPPMTLGPVTGPPPMTGGPVIVVTFKPPTPAVTQSTTVKDCKNKTTQASR